jgi:hypothetical protein
MRRTRAWGSLACLGLAAVALGSCDAYTPTAPRPDPTPVPQPQPTPIPIATSSPEPNASPASCPPLTRWSSGIHNVTDALSKPVPSPIVGGHVLIDSTPLFNNRPCNAERNSCGGRQCEDPRGGVWTLLEGDSPAQPRGEGYQFRIGPLVAGVHRWRVCPREDAMDPQGVLLVTSQDACTEGVFIVPLPEETE